MKSAIVDSSEILDSKKNPTLCLSPLRYTGGCHKCSHYLSFKSGARQSLKCNPIISEEVQEKLKLIEQLEKQKARINTEIERLEVSL